MLEPTNQTEVDLPFDNGAKDEIWFQNVCTEIIAYMPEYKRVQQYGVSGNKQGGIDISAHEGVNVVGFQCKHYTTTPFRPADVTKAVKAVKAATFPAERFVIMLASDDRFKAIDEIAKHEGWNLWDKRKLSQIVRSLDKERGIDIVRTFFTPAWAESFFGEARARSFVDGSAFYKPFVAPQLIDHSRALVNRQEVTDAISAFVSSDKKVLIATGKMGVGKSKIFHESLMRRMDGHRVRYVERGVTITEASLHELLPGPLLIIIDAIENIADVERLLPYVAGRADVKLVIGARPSALRSLESALARSGLDPFSQTRVAIGPLGRANMRTLIEQTEPTLNRDSTRFVIARAAGSPLAALAMVRILKSPPENRAETIRLVQASVLQHFGPAVDGKVDDRIEPSHAQAVMTLCAALSPIRDDTAFYEVAAQYAAVPSTDVRRIVGLLEQICLARQDGGVGFDSEILQAAILHEAAFVGASSAGAIERILERFGYADVLRNAILADQYFPHGSAIADLVWPTLVHIARDGSNSERIDLLKALDGVGAALPERVLSLVRRIIKTPAPIESFLDGLYSLDHADVVEKVPGVLEPILEYEVYATEVVRLLWNLAVGDERRQSSTPDHPVRVIKEAIEYRGGRPVARSVAIIDAIGVLNQKNDLDESLYSPVQLLEPAFALSAMRSEESDDESSMTITRFAFRPSSLCEPRRRAIEIALRDVRGDADRRADRAIQVLKAIFSFSGIVSNAAEEADVAVRNEEKSVVLDTFHGIIESRRFPLRELRIAEVLRSALRYSPDAMTTRVTDMLRSIAIDDERALLSSLAPGLRREIEPSDDVRQALADHCEHVVDTYRVAAGSLLVGCSDREELVAQLKRAASRVRSAGLSLDMTSIMSALAEIDFEAALEITRLSLTDGEGSLFFGMAGALQRAWQVAPEVAFDLSAEALNLSDPDARIAVVHGISYRGAATEDDTNTKRLVILNRALQDANVAVRRTAAINSFSVLDGQSNEAVNSLMVLPFEDAQVVDDLFRLFYNREDAIVELPSNKIETLCRKLEEVPALGHWCLHFLGTIVPTYMGTVAGVLIERALHPYSPQYDALPFGSLKDLGRALRENKAVGAAIRAVLAVVVERGKAVWGLRELVGLLYQIDTDTAGVEVLNAAAAANADALCNIARTLEQVHDESLLAGTVVSALVERAYEEGDEVGEGVASALRAALTGGMRSGPVGEPFAADIALRDGARLQRAKASAGSDLATFWAEIEAEAIRRIRTDDD